MMAIDVHRHQPAVPCRRHPPMPSSENGALQRAGETGGRAATLAGRRPIIAINWHNNGEERGIARRITW